jgi:DNA repair photolyase
MTQYARLLNILKSRSAFNPGLADNLFLSYNITDLKSFKYPLFNVLNLHRDCSLCRYGFQIDVWQGYCPHSCIYCWAKWTGSSDAAVSAREGIMPFDFVSFWYAFYSSFENTSDKEEPQFLKYANSDLVRSLITLRVPIRIGCFYDSFIEDEVKWKLTYNVIRLLNFYNYPFVVVTKSPIISESPWIDEMVSENGVVQMSISASDYNFSALLEPGAPDVNSRFDALKILSSKNIYTCIRINPLFPWGNVLNTVSEKEKDSLSNFLAYPDTDLLDRAVECNVKGIVAGVLNMDKNNWPRLLKILSKYYMLPGFYDEKNWQFSSEIISGCYSFLSRECKKRGLEFSTCYLGRGLDEYERYRHLWSCSDHFCSIGGCFKNDENKIIEVIEQYKNSSGLKKDFALINRENSKPDGFIKKFISKSAEKIIDFIVSCLHKK